MSKKSIVLLLCDPCTRKYTLVHNRNGNSDGSGDNFSRADDGDDWVAAKEAEIPLGKYISKKRQNKKSKKLRRANAVVYDASTPTAYCSSYDFVSKKGQDFVPSHITSVKVGGGIKCSVLFHGESNVVRIVNMVDGKFGKRLTLSGNVRGVRDVFFNKFNHNLVVLDVDGVISEHKVLSFNEIVRVVRRSSGGGGRIKSRSNHDYDGVFAVGSKIGGYNDATSAVYVEGEVLGYGKHAVVDESSVAILEYDNHDGKGLIRLYRTGGGEGSNFAAVAKKHVKEYRGGTSCCINSCDYKVFLCLENFLMVYRVQAVGEDGNAGMECGLDVVKRIELSCSVPPSVLNCYEETNAGLALRCEGAALSNYLKIVKQTDWDIEGQVYFTGCCEEENRTATSAAPMTQGGMISAWEYVLTAADKSKNEEGESGGDDGNVVRRLQLEISRLKERETRWNNVNRNLIERLTSKNGCQEG